MELDADLHPESLFDESPWLEGNLADWEAMFPHAKLVSYKKHAIIYHQNCVEHNAYIIRTGRVNLSIVSHDGAEKSLYVATTGAAFGEVPLISGIQVRAQATAKTECQLYMLPGPQFLKHIYSNPQITQAFARLAAKKIHLLTGQMELLCFFDINYRVCKMLIYLAQQYGVKTSGGLKIDIRFTHQELASMVGASRVSVTKLLNDLSKAGVIGKKDGKFFVVDTDTLYAHALRTHARNANMA